MADKPIDLPIFEQNPHVILDELLGKLETMIKRNQNLYDQIQAIGKNNDHCS